MRLGNDFRIQRTAKFSVFDHAVAAAAPAPAPAARARGATRRCERAAAAAAADTADTADGDANPRVVHCDVKTSTVDTSQLVVRTGVSVIVMHPDGSGRVLVGVRKGSHGAGTLAFPGGHLEFGEDWWQCALREVKEETDLDLAGPESGSASAPRFVGATNDLFVSASGPPKQYTTIFLRCQVRSDSAELRLMEPHKCEAWQWVDPNTLGSEGTPRLFLPLQNFLRAGGTFAQSQWMAYNLQPIPSAQSHLMAYNLQPTHSIVT